eukprot:scaffold59858_cov47-Prasinocladus_malaysianus.AAC.1
MVKALSVWCRTVDARPWSVLLSVGVPQSPVKVPPSRLPNVVMVMVVVCGRERAPRALPGHILARAKAACHAAGAPFRAQGRPAGRRAPGSIAHGAGRRAAPAAAEGGPPRPDKRPLLLLL